MHAQWPGSHRSYVQQMPHVCSCITAFQRQCSQILKKFSLLLYHWCWICCFWRLAPDGLPGALHHHNHPVTSVDFAAHLPLKTCKGLGAEATRVIMDRSECEFGASIACRNSMHRICVEMNTACSRRSCHKLTADNFEFETHMM